MNEFQLAFFLLYLGFGSAFVLYAILAKPAVHEGDAFQGILWAVALIMPIPLTNESGYIPFAIGWWMALAVLAIRLLRKVAYAKPAEKAKKK